MRIELIPSIEYVEEHKIKGKTAIVIDVLRATSVITTALYNGASEVVPVIEIEEALALKDDNTLLGGERKALKIDGFDFGNSPIEYTRDKVSGKRVVLSTTNGTKTIHKAASAGKIILGTVISGKAVAKYAVGQSDDIVVICAGTGGKFSLDDFLCAGKIIHEIKKLATCECDDFASAALLGYENNKGDLMGYVRHAAHYQYLLSINLAEDIKFCFTEDKFYVVPVVTKNKNNFSILLQNIV